MLLYLVCYSSAISSVAHWHEHWDHHTDLSKYSTWELTVTGTRCLLLNCKKMANDETVNPYGKLSRLLLPWGLNGARLPWHAREEPPGSPNSKQKGGVRTAGSRTPGAVLSLLRACVNSSKGGKKSTLLPWNCGSPGYLQQLRKPAKPPIISLLLQEVKEVRQKVRNIKTKHYWNLHHLLGAKHHYMAPFTVVLSVCLSQLTHWLEAISVLMNV